MIEYQLGAEQTSLLKSRSIGRGSLRQGPRADRTVLVPAPGSTCHAPDDSGRPLCGYSGGVPALAPLTWSSRVERRCQACQWL